MYEQSKNSIPTNDHIKKFVAETSEMMITNFSPSEIVTALNDIKKSVQMHWDDRLTRGAKELEEMKAIAKPLFEI